MSNAGVSRLNTKKTTVFRIEKINDLRIDLFYDHEVYAPAKVRVVLEEFGLVTALAHGCVCIDLAPTQNADDVVAYLKDYSLLDAREARLLWNRKKE